MNKLKDHCKVNNLHYFLTYADNNAIGYFKKQGFSTFVKMSVDHWKEYESNIINIFSYIKDYDGGTLMEAYCNPEIDYSNLSEIIKKQKEVIRRIIKKSLNVKTRRSFTDLEKGVKGIKKVNK